MAQEGKLWFWKAPDRFLPVRWSTAARLSRTRLPQLVSLIPVLGYAVLWSDQAQTYLMRFQVLTGSGILSPLGRTYFLYIGSLWVLIGLVIYWLACPLPVRRFADRRAYAEHMVTDGTVVEFAQIFETLDGLVGNGADHPNGPFLGVVSGSALRGAMVLGRCSRRCRAEQRI